MCLKAEEETRDALRSAEEARARAAKSEEKEKAAFKEASDAAKRLAQVSKECERLTNDHKREKERLNEDYLSKADECKTLVQRNITLRNEFDEVSRKAAAYDALVAERNDLARRVDDLKESLSESKVMAERGGHYKQITAEMEERVADLEKELVQTAQRVGLLEKRLEESDESLRKARGKNERLMQKVRRLEAVEAQNASSNALDGAREALISDVESKQRELGAAQARVKELAHMLDAEQLEKQKLLSDLSELEDRFLGAERQHTSSAFQLKRQLSVVKKDLEECKKYAGQLELERQSLCAKLHVKPDPNLGFEDSRGGGSFRDSPSMSNSASRNGLSAIDALYLKNVLFKFIEATAKGKTAERDMLLPPVATLLGASSEEFAQLKKSLTEDESASAGFFGFWSK